MYILQKDNHTFYGPNIWNVNLIKSFIQDDFEIDADAPISAPISGTNIGNDIFVYEVINVDIPEYNPKIERLEGPFYTIADDKATQYFGVVDKNIDQVKSELFALAAHLRWVKETSGVEVTIGTDTIKATTERGLRDMYAQAAQNGIISPWKFTKTTGETLWLVPTVQQLQQIAQAVSNHVQDAFSWEKSKVDEIVNASSLIELDIIGLD